MRSTMLIPAARLRLFQKLVKQHNLRFVGNPFVTGEKAFVEIDGTYLTASEYSEFLSDWTRLNTPIRETKSPSWKRILLRLGVAI